MRRLAAGAASLVAPYVARARRERVVLTSFHGRGYRGNPRAIFERLMATGELEPIWLSSAPEVVADLQRRFGSDCAALVHSAVGVRAVAEARAIVLSHGITDLEYIHLNRKAVVLQSWHGLPTKRGGLMDSPTLRERAATALAWAPVTQLLSSGPLVSELYRARFGLRSSAMLELGYPAHDALVHGPVLDTEAAFVGAPDHGTVIVYAPTFREQAPTQLFPFADFDARALAGALDDLGALLLLRPHPNDRLDLRRLRAASARVRIADDRVIEDPFALLRRADAIVTDYSGVYLEGLLCDTPCVFVPYDRADYERGLAFDYDAMTPGPKAATFDAFVGAVTDAVTQPRLHEAARTRVRDQFFSHTDGRATDRVVQWLTAAVR